MPAHGGCKVNCRTTSPPTNAHRNRENQTSEIVNFGHCRSTAETERKKNRNVHCLGLVAYTSVGGIRCWLRKVHRLSFYSKHHHHHRRLDESRVQSGLVWSFVSHQTGPLSTGQITSLVWFCLVTGIVPDSSPDWIVIVVIVIVIINTANVLEHRLFAVPFSCIAHFSCNSSRSYFGTFR